MPRRPADDLDLRGLLVQIKVDPKYKKFARIVQRVSDRLDIEKDRTEALALHASRSSRALHGGKRYSPKALIDASLQDLHARSRLVEIRVKASNHIEVLDDGCDAIKHHLLTQYNQELRPFGTEAQRQALIKRVQRQALDLMVEGKSLLDMLDQIIKDIDQASYSLRATLDSLKLLDGAKAGRVV
jgi:hypothetical protein